MKYGLCQTRLKLNIRGTKETQWAEMMMFASGDKINLFMFIKMIMCGLPDVWQ